MIFIYIQKIKHIYLYFNIINLLSFNLSSLVLSLRKRLLDFIYIILLLNYCFFFFFFKLF